MQHGFVQLLETGSLRVRDELGWREIQRTATGISHAEVTGDGKQLVATTPAGEILVWDLRAVAPRRLTIPRMWTPFAMRDQATWLWNSVGGVGRLDLRTGTFEVVLDRVDAHFIVIDGNERWVAGMSEEGKLYTVDRTNGAHLYGGEVEFVFDDGIGVTVARPDGSLWRWRPGGSPFREAGSFGGTPKLMTAFGPHAAALVGDQLVRVDEVTRQAERLAALPRVTALALLPDGGVAVLADHLVWIWRPGAHFLAKLPVDEPIDEIATSGPGLVMSSTRAVATLYDGVVAITAVPAGELLYASRDRAVVETPRGELELVELPSGFSFALPESVAVGFAVANRDRVALIAKGEEGDDVVSIWDMTVPSEPLALAAWLGTITNAKRAGDSEIYSWP
jgi:hypothetical protein